MADEVMEVFFDVQSDLPRQGPGDSDSTRRALALCNPLPSAPRVLDIGCGPGAQTLMKAVSAWRPLLKQRGFLALTELVWLTEDKPVEAAEFFREEYPAMMDGAGIVEGMRAVGYELIDHFTLPDSAWWDAYYTPLLARLPALESKHAGDTTGLSVIASAREEVEIRRRFASSYGYEFFVVRKTE